MSYLTGDRSGLDRAGKRAALNQLQGGCCAVCRAEGRLVADHDHDTGRLRGLICRSCNQREGRLRSGNTCEGYEDIHAYLANPPAACMDWLWGLPEWWCGLDTRQAIRQGMTVLEFVTANPGLGQHRVQAVQAQAIRALESIDLPEVRV